MTDRVSSHSLQQQHQQRKVTNVDRFVQQYLINQGFSQAAAALDRELGKDPDGLSGLPPIDLLMSNVAETVFVRGIAADAQGIYSTELDSFSSWVANSLDIMKPYLLAANFAIFCHCYISLIRYGKGEEAQQIMQTYESIFRQSFEAEVKRLSVLLRVEQLTDSSFLSSNTFINAAILGKFNIKMSSLALSLLSQKLKQDNLVLIAAVINDKVTFNRISEAVDDNTQLLLESSDLITLPGYDPVDDGKDLVALKLGVLGTGDYYKHWQERSALFQDIDFPELASDHLMDIWVRKVVRSRSVLKKFVRKDGSIPPLFEGQQLDTLLGDCDQIFTPLHSDSAASSSASSSSSSSRTTMGDALNPSVLFVTLSNGYEGVTSLDITPTVTQAASGHDDCIVRVWRLDQKNENHDVNPWFGRNLPPVHEWGFHDVLPKPKRSSASSAASASAPPRGTSSGLNGSRMNGNSHSKKPKNAFASVEFVGHSQPVMAVSQSKDERLILSCSVDESIRLWDTAVVQCVGRYNCFSVPWDVKFSPLHDYFAAGNADRSVSAYCTDREAPIRLMTGHTNDVNCIAWHGNGQLLASGSDDRSVRLWDLRTAECVRLLRHCSSPVTCLQVSNIGNLIAAGTEHGRVYLWDLRSTRQLAICQGHQGPVHSLSFAHGIAPALASGGADCAVRVWDLTPAIETSYRAPLSAKMGQESYAVAVLSPKHSFFTKACPVLHVGFAAENMLYAGGSFSQAAAVAIREKNSAEGVDAVAEQLLIRSFGMHGVVPT